LIIPFKGVNQNSQTALKQIKNRLLIWNWWELAGKLSMSLQKMAKGVALSM
jgi:hypothetical protein